MKFLDFPKTVTVGTSSTLDIVMPKVDRPFRELTIWGIPRSDKAVGAAAGTRNFSSQVFFGHSSQAAAAPRTDDNRYLIYDPGDKVIIWPANEPSSNPTYAGKEARVVGFPITVRIVNSDATNALVITIEFLAMTIDQG